MAFGDPISSFPYTAFDATENIIYGIAIDVADGSLWMSGGGNDKTYHVSITGSLIGSHTHAFDPAGLQRGMDMAPGGNLWYGAQSSNKINEVDPSSPATVVSTFGGTAIDPSFAFPFAVAYDSSDDTLWTHDAATKKVYNITLTGSVISSFPITTVNAGINVLQSLTIGNDGTLWGSEASQQVVYNFGTTGNVISSFSHNVVDAGLTTVTDIAQDSSGNLWLSAPNQDLIWEVVGNGATGGGGGGGIAGAGIYHHLRNLGVY